jgi:hypothetical protein
MSARISWNICRGTAHLGHLKRDATAMAEDVGADLDQLLCFSKVGYGSMD